MQHDDLKSPQKRPRAKTGTTFPGILKGLKSEPSSAVTTVPLAPEDPATHMSLEGLVKALMPPAKPSTSHVTALVQALKTETPNLDLITPVIARLCAPGVSSDLLASGLDVISACAASHNHIPTDLQRASLFSILRNSDSGWALDTCKSRYNCLWTLSEEGSNVAGFEVQFLRFSEECISSAFQGLLSEDDSDRADRESYIKTISRIMRKVLNRNEDLYTKNDILDVLTFFGGLVRQSLDYVTGQLGSDAVSIPSSPVTTPTPATHRRNALSLSGSMSYSGNRLLREPITPPDRTALPIELYMNFLETYYPRLSSMHMTDIVSVLSCVVAVHITPLPRISAWPTPQHQPHPSENAALTELFKLLSGPCSETVAINLRCCLASENWQEALGSFRTIRAVLRDAAESRMARIVLRRGSDNYAPTGQLVATDMDAGVLERAYKEGLLVASLTPKQLCDCIGEAVHVWSARFHPEKVLEEALGIAKDIVAEASDRIEENAGEESSLDIDVDEGHLTGTILSEAVRYIHRVRPLYKTPFLPIDKPSAAPTPLLLTLCTLLSLPLSIPITPSLHSILFSLAPVLTDSQTGPIPGTMHNLGLLTPPSPEWLNNVTDLFQALVARERPFTSRKVVRTVQSVHSNLKDENLYRSQLGRCICEILEHAFDRDDHGVYAAMDGDESWVNLCADELVWRIMESPQPVDSEGPQTDEKDDNDVVARLIRLLVRHAEGPCPCSTTVDADDGNIPPSPSQSHEGHVTSTPGHSYPPSNSETPALSRVSSDLIAREKEVSSAQSIASSSTSVLPPLMSMLPVWRMPRNREQEAPTSPVTTRSDAEGPTILKCRPFLTSVALVKAFQALSFSASPRAAHSIRLFKNILSVLSNTKCPRAKLVSLQFLMRLRADREHRLYVVDRLDDDIQTLAILVDRSRLASREPPEAEVRRARSTSRGMPKRKPRSSAGSRSRSRPAPVIRPVPARTNSREPLWMVPESLPFDVLDSELSSDGITTYEVNAPTEWEDLKHWLLVSDYVFALVDILKSETDWDILSYVLCHLPVQLANKHFFCGPKTKDAIVALLTTLCTVTFKGESGHIITEHLPESLRLRDAQGLVYHTLTVLISYRRIFDERKHHDMLVEAFLAGLNSQPSTVKFCLHALSICAFELPKSITKNLSHILEKLTRIMTNAAMAVHILDFVSIVGSLPSLYANFREQEFKLVFAVAVTYIHHHNSPDTRGLSGRESFALSQHVLVIAYYIIYVWFLAVALPDRPNHVEFLTRRLLLANEAKGAVDEPTKVCFDWLARYTFAATDPKLTYSQLGEIVMDPPRHRSSEPGGPSNHRSVWLWGNSLVLIRPLPGRGLIEVESVRPSGETRFLCKLERNLSQATQGYVNPDGWGDPTRMGRNEPDSEDSQAKHTPMLRDEHTPDRVRGVLPSPAKPETSEDRPDPETSHTTTSPQLLRENVIDPSFFAVQLSQYPSLAEPNIQSKLIPRTPQLESLLGTLKLTPVIDTHKIAILYVAPGQKTEREILGNRQGSTAYTRFLEGMGRLISVRDQRDMYTGDLRPETDGEFAYAWRDDIVQVVYHTATLMPNIPSDPIFINKKRHIGNDKVRIVWNDSGLSYAHHTIPSAYNFVNLIIQPHSVEPIAMFSDNLHEHEFFKVTMQRMEGMPEFGPIGDYKLVSAENLAPLLRQVSLLADFFSEVYEATDKDTSTHEYVTNWRRRLQYINNFRSRSASASLPPEPARTS